jgi:IS30 family transposase
MPPRQCKSKIIEPTTKSHLSDSEIMRILTLAHTGVSTQTIADQVNRSQSTVGRIKRTVTEGSGLSVGEPKKTQNQDNLENARIEEDY